MEKADSPPNGILADKFFSRGFHANAQHHLERAEEELARGANEQAAEHLKRVKKNSAAAIMNTTSPRLTEKENEELLRLSGKAWSVGESGIARRNNLSKADNDRYNFLQRKAHGSTEEE